MGVRTRICIIGGGSYNWAPVLLRDFAVTPGISGSIVLHDIDTAAADGMVQLGRKLVQATGADLTIETNPDLRDALAGANFVIVTITTGGIDATEHDLEIPLRYGIVQSVGDTVGPGGLARALRNIPVFVDLARAMEEICPDAWLLNLTNPMTTLVRAVTKLTRIKTIGLCHEVFGTRRALMQMFGTGESQIELQIAGVNHLIWLLQAKIDGRDALDLLRCHLANGGEIPLKPFKGEHMAPFQDRWRLKLALFDRYGVLPAAGDRHLAEFFPYFLANASRAATDYGVLPTTIAHRRAMLAQAKGQVRAWITGDAPLNLEPSEEEVAGIVAAVANGRSRRAVMNLPNKGQISNLPRDAVVETVGQIGPTGAHGISVGDLPLGVLSTITPHVHTSELIIEAALTGSRSLALQALLNDPLTRDFESAPRLLDDLLRAHAPFLSTFSA